MTNKHINDTKEIMKYKDDFLKFIEDYKISFNSQNNYKCELLPLLDFERELLEFMYENKFSIIKKSRQMHLTTIVAAYCAWSLLFKENYVIGIVSYKIKNSNNLIEKVRIILQNFSNSFFHWEDDFVKNNKSEIRLTNGSLIKSFTPKNAGAGYTINMFIIDEAAFIDLEKVFKYIFPIVKSLQDSKIIIYSTPNGNNYFKKLWEDSVNRKNDFEVISINWTKNPYYDEKWFNGACLYLNNNENSIKQELWAEFVEKPKLSSMRINFRLDTEIYEKMIEKNQNTNISEYIRDLIKKDLDI